MNRPFQRNAAGCLLLCLLALVGCTHDPDMDPLDARLLDMARSSEGFTWYDGTSTALPRSTGSGHQEPYLRTRYNATAAAVLDTGLMVTLDTLFPEGAMVVKELMSDASTVDTYAILLKESSNPYADASGWVWGYMRTDGTVRVPASDKGAACRSCHTQAGHIDQTLMNISFP
jgi:hypothetical protein